MEEAEYCDRLALDEPRQARRPGHPGRTAREHGRADAADGTDDAPRAVPALAGAAGVLEASTLRPRRPGGRCEAMRRGRALTAHRRLPGIVCRAIERIEPSLEDVFVARVRRAGGADDRMTTATLQSAGRAVSARAALAVARKECLQLRRDRRSLALAFLLPPSCCYCSSATRSARTSRISRWRSSTRTDTPEAAQLIAAFERSGYFAMVARPDGYRGARTADGPGRRSAWRWSSRGASPRTRLPDAPAPVEVLLDGSDAKTATVARGYAEAIAREFSSDGAAAAPGRAAPAVR